MIDIPIENFLMFMAVWIFGFIVGYWFRKEIDDYEKTRLNGK